MPVRKVKGGYAIGSGSAVYKTKESADKAYRAYLAKKNSKDKGSKKTKG